MDAITAPALLALAVGLIGLAACAAAMAQVLPSPGWLDWLRRRDRRVGVPPTSLERGGRRVVTGASAADRLGNPRPPARRPALRPDVLRRERERLTAEESRRIVERLADEDPARLAGVVGALLASDAEHSPNDQRDVRRRGRREGTR